MIRRSDPETGVEFDKAGFADPAPTETAELSEINRILRHVSILVIDDEPGMLNFIQRTLGPRCKRIEVAASAEEATRLLDKQHFDLLILDNVMPGQSGLDWLSEQRRIGLFAEAILITAYADLETAIHALRVGVADFLLKPFRSNQILNAAARCMDQRFLRHENFLLKHELRADTLAARGRLIGKSPGISAVRQTVERVARLPTPVLFTGESGTGKEIAARTLHALSDRAERPFVPVNCAALLPERINADLFGEVGADGNQGLLSHASGGTLFFDEIGELPLTVQATLLRVIEDGRIRPMGAEREIPLNLRFVFASNTDLAQLVASGRFRRDLYHRVNVLTVDMPPLRDRIGDLGELAEMFMGNYARQLGMPPLTVSEAVVMQLARYDWPGNVRELRNLIERSVILGKFPPEFAGEEGTAQEPVESLHEVERRHILAILEACGGNRAEAARRLGVSRKTIDRKCAMWNG